MIESKPHFLGMYLARLILNLNSVRLKKSALLSTKAELSLEILRNSYSREVNWISGKGIFKPVDRLDREVWFLIFQPIQRIQFAESRITLPSDPTVSITIVWVFFHGGLILSLKNELNLRIKSRIFRIFPFLKAFVFNSLRSWLYGSFNWRCQRNTYHSFVWKTILGSLTNSCWNTVT